MVVLVLLVRWGDKLELGVELADAVRRQQEQQVAAQDLAAPRGGRQARVVHVVHLQLRDVALETVQILLVNGQVGRKLKRFPSQQQFLLIGILLSGSCRLEIRDRT